MSTDYKFEEEEKKFTALAFKNKVEVASLPLKFVLNGSIKKNHVDYEVLAQYATSSVASNLNADRSRKAPGDWNAKFDVAANKHKIEVTTVRDIDEGAQKSAVSNELKSSFGTDIVFNVKFDNVLSRDKADIVADGTIVLAKGQKPLKLEYKLSVTPKHAETNGKILADTTELVKFNAVLNRNAGDINTPITGTLELNVHDLVTANGNYESVKGDGKSNLIVAFSRLDRKIKVDTTYNHGAHKFDLRNDFYYNFEKDNTRHIAFDTKNEYQDNKLQSLNEIDINGEKIQFNIDGTGTGNFKKGVQNGKFLLRLPTQREISGSLDRNVDFTSEKAFGHGIIKLTDKLAKAGGKSRSAQLEFTLKDGNFESRLFDTTHKATFIDFDGKDIVITNHVKHLPKGQFKQFGSTLKIGGSSVPNAVEFGLGVDEYCSVHAVFHASAKYGNSVTVGLNGDYAIGEPGAKPSTFKLSGDVALPQTKLKQLSFNSRGSAKYPEPKDHNGQYEYDFKFNGKVNDKDLSFETNGKANPSSGDLSLAVKVPETEPFALELSYNRKDEAEQQLHHAQGNVQVRYGNGKNIKISGDSKIIENKEISFVGSIVTPYEKAKSMDVTFKFQKKDEETYANEAELNIDDRKYRLTNVAVISRVNPSIALDVYYPQNGHSQVAASIARTNDRKYKSSLRLLNINGFHLTGDSELSYQSIENFGLLIDLDSEALKANKLHIDIHTKQNGNNKGIEFSATEAGKNIISGTADYGIKEEKGKTTIDGKGSVNWYDQSNAITFQFMKNTFDQQHNNETGVMVSYS